MALAPGADFISLKDEYRNMAGDKLPLTNDPLPNIQTNKAGFGTDLTVGDKYENLINIKGAKFLDLYRGSIKIDDADDLKEALKSYDVEMSIAFNDNPDNDEFRKAYIVVITNLTKKDTTTTPEPTTGNVKLASGVTGTTIKSGKFEVMGNGNSYLSVELEVPAWASFDGGVAANDLKIEYRILNGDGSTYAVGASSIDSKTKAAGSATDLVPNSDNADKVTTFSISNKAIPELTASTKAPTGTPSLEITKVTWSAVKVQYKLGSADLITETGTTPDAELTTASAGDQLDFQPSQNDYVIGASGASYTITGVNPVASSDKTTGSITSLASNTTTDDVYAVGNGYVVVTVTGLEANAGRTVSISSFANAAGNAWLIDSTTATMTMEDVNDDLTGNDDTIMVTVTGGAATTGSDDDAGSFSGMKAGERVTLKVEVGAGTVTDVDYYLVSMKLTSKSTGAVVSSFTNEKMEAGDTYTWDVLTVSEDLEIKAENVTITAVKKAMLESASYKDGVLTMTYDKDLDASTLGSAVVALSGTTGTCDVAFDNLVGAAVSVSGKSLIVRLSGTKFGVGDAVTLKIVGNTLKAADGTTVESAHWAKLTITTANDFSEVTANVVDT